MEFEEISKMAYNKEHLDKKSTILENFIWYKMRELYDSYSKRFITLEESKFKKQRLKVFYLQEVRLQEFDKKLHDKRYKNIRESEDILKNILNDIDKKVPKDELIEELINYIVRITGIVLIKTNYDNNYKVN